MPGFLAFISKDCISKHVEGGENQIDRGGLNIALVLFSRVP